MTSNHAAILSVLQPWASLIAEGKKRIETRSWPTRYRGRILIHASLGRPGWARTAWNSSSLLRDVRASSFADLPRGVILASARLVDVEQFGFGFNWRDRYSAEECARGKIEFGQFGWMLAGVLALRSPIAWRGRLGLVDCPADILERVDADLALLGDAKAPATPAATRRCTGCGTPIVTAGPRCASCANLQAARRVFRGTPANE